MAEWLVEWRFDVEADDPTDAARQALEAITREGSIAHVFDVTSTPYGEPAGEKVTIDLNYPDE